MNVPRTLLLALLAAVLLTAAPAQAASNQTMTFEAPAQLLDDGARDATLDEIRAFGVTQVRVLAYWQSFAPNADSRTAPSFDTADPNAYPAGTWDKLDRLFAATQARGMKVLVTLTGPVPKWATRDKRDNLSYPNPVLFGKWANAIGRRFGDRVDMWSIWNEPNQPQFLLPQYRNGKPASPDIYRNLYRAAYTGLRATPANLEDDILLGETSPRGNARVVHPLAFLRGTLCLNSRYRRVRSCKLQADGYAHHAYTTRVGPHFKPDHKDDVTIGVLSRLVRALDRAGRAGAIPRGLDVYLTEFGIQSAPDPFVGVSTSQQAEYLAISERLAFSNPRVRAFSQYLMQDDQPRAGSRLERYSGFESGLRYADGRPKPAYDAFRLPLTARKSSGRDSLWGLVRPFPRTTQVVIEKRDRGGDWSELVRVTTNAAGVWARRTASKSGRRYRVRWTSPTGEQFTGPPVRAY